MVHAFTKFLAAKAFGRPLPPDVDDDVRDALHAMLAAEPGSLAFKAHYALIVMKCSPYECKWGFPYYDGIMSWEDRYLPSRLHASRMVYDQAGTTHDGPGHTAHEHPFGTASKILYAAMLFECDSDDPSSTEIQTSDGEPMEWNDLTPTYEEYRDLELEFRASQAKKIQRSWRAFLHRKRVLAASVIKAAWKYHAYHPSRPMTRSRVLANFEEIGL